jgi:hypothetical protein
MSGLGVRYFTLGPGAKGGGGGDGGGGGGGGGGDSSKGGTGDDSLDEARRIMDKYK